jgi:hypothetical protein
MLREQWPLCGSGHMTSMRIFKNRIGNYLQALYLSLPIEKEN